MRKLGRYEIGLAQTAQEPSRGCLTENSYLEREKVRLLQNPTVVSWFVCLDRV